MTVTCTVHLTRKACKQLATLTRMVQDLADLAIADLEEQGVHPQGWDTLKTGDREYRLRLNYRYRMRYRMTADKGLEIEVFTLDTDGRPTDEPSNDYPSRSG